MLRFWKRGAEKQRPVRHALAIATLLLLPLLAAVGSLAPVVVTVQYQEEEVFPPPKREPRRAVRLAHRALLAAHDYSTRWMPEMVDLDKLFVRPRYRVHVARRSAQRAEMPLFPPARGDMIVLSERGDNCIGDTLFKDTLQPGVVADATAVWDPRLFDVIADTTRPHDTDQFDDFTGQGETEEPPTIVPEPGTGSLLALGLALLALRARQRQPATS